MPFATSIAATSSDSDDTPRTQAASPTSKSHKLKMPPTARRSTSNHNGDHSTNNTKEEEEEEEAPIHSGKTLSSYILPPTLRLHPHDTHFQNSGMEVYKVSKNGKCQARRIAIAPNNRAIYISSHRYNYNLNVIGSTMSNRVLMSTLLTLKSRGGGSDLSNSAGVNSGNGNSSAMSNGHHQLPVKEIDLSRVVRMQLGQQSRRFERAR